MPALPVRRRCLAIGAWMACLSACSAPPLEPIGAEGWGPTGERSPDRVEEPRTPAPRPKSIPVASRKRWEHADALEALKLVAGRSRTEHLDDSYTRSVAINDAAAAYERLVPGIVMPEGAMVAQRHHRGGDEVILHWFVMLKGARGSSPAQGDWRFVVLDDALRVAAAEPLELCARCHRDAPHDSLFGPPQLDP